MPIAYSDKIVALLSTLSAEDIEALPPAERRRFASSCRRAAALADPPREPAGRGAASGVLSQLNGGDPRHGG